MSSRFFKGLKCNCCTSTHPVTDSQAVQHCDNFAPLEPFYDLDAIGRSVTRQEIESRPKNIWRYKEFLPLVGEEGQAGQHTGFTPLINAPRLAKELGVAKVWVKNDTVNHPSWSFKDRVVAVALSRALELGFDTVGCSSTGNLAHSVGAQAAELGLQSYVFIPHDLESAKIQSIALTGANIIPVKGSYDDAKHLCSLVGQEFTMGLVNVNLRAYYAEGSKTIGFEIAEQLGWRLPEHIIAPMASGSMLTKIDKGFRELIGAGLLSEQAFKIHGAQATGCSPIATAFKEGKNQFRPIKNPNTIVKSLAIGDPADGDVALRKVRATKGGMEHATDDEVREGIKLLARTTGIYAETAGGVTVACAKKLIETGFIPSTAEIVLVISGNGLKTPDACGAPTLLPAIASNLKAFEDATGLKRQVRQRVAEVVG